MRTERVLGRTFFRNEIEGASGAHPVSNRWQAWALLAAFALVVVFRLPHAWVHGRFQDEEATVFLAYAWHHHWLDALFRPFAGYLNLGATVTTVLVAQLARTGMLRLESAPYLTMTIALAFQLLPAALILTGKAQWLEGRLAKITALLIVAIAPATEEVFFNVLHIQFHLALCVALILALNVPRRHAANIGYGVLLFLAPLCGPAAIVVLPLFVVRATLERCRRRLVQSALLSAGAVIQLLLFYGSSPLRGHVADPETLSAAIFVRLIALPLTGVRSADYLANEIQTSLIGDGALLFWVATATVILFGLLIAVAAKRRDGAIWLVLSALGIAIASFGFGIVSVDPAELFSAIRGERYNFIPVVLLGLSFIALASRRSGMEKRIFASLCGMMLFSGALSYSKPYQDYAEGPSWPAEMRAWRRDHHHPLAVWPGRWSADLSDEIHSCSPPAKEPIHPARMNGYISPTAQPRYCEGGWAAGFHRGN